MSGRAYNADLVKKDLERISEIMEEMKSDFRVGNSLSEWFEEMDKILEAYNL